jgi:positive regulator of sigma E activity
VGFYRVEVDRQVRLLRSVWRWYLGPLVPGLLWLFAANAVVHSKSWLGLGRVLLTALVTAVVFFVVARVNRRAATELSSELIRLEDVCR